VQRTVTINAQYVAALYLAKRFSVASTNIKVRCTCA
jgi:hypothetical protein